MGIAEIMGGEPEAIKIPEVGSTDWMDGIRTVEDVINKYKLVIWCEACKSWYHFERDPNSKALLASHGIICDCGESKGFITSSIISERTWSPDKKPPKITKKRR